MFRLRSFACVAGVIVAVVVGGSSRPAFAIKQFFDEFKAMYVKPDSSDGNEKALAAEVETAKCNVCHVGKNKKERNSYGHALAELLDKKEDAKNVAKIKESLEKVASLPSDPKKADSATFGDRIKEGKLPAVAAE
ncbi:MAG: hypothetical protein WCQ91_02515 [Planctomycetota bacterium]